MDDSNYISIDIVVNILYKVKHELWHLCITIINKFIFICFRICR